MNVALLTVALSASGAWLVRTYAPQPPPEAEAQPGGSAAAREVVVDVRPPPGPSTLVLTPRVAPMEEPVVDRTAPARSQVHDLPDLSRFPVTDGLLDRAVTLARQHPDDELLRVYVAAAHLLLAARYIPERRTRDALRLVDEAEGWGASKDQTAAFRALAYEQDQQWELGEKWARTALAYGARSNAAEMHHIIGKALYFREELDKAIEELEAAVALRDDPRFRASLDLALRDARSSRGFDRQRLSHFIVSYEGETMEDTGRMVLDAMERSYASLVSQLGFQPSEPVVVLLYSRRSYREMGGPHWSAGLFDGKIRIPVQGLQTLDEHVKTTLHHELAHAFIHARAGTAAPRWLHEGLAEYVEGARGEEGARVAAQLLQQGHSFQGCLSAGSCDVRLFYPAATSLVSYMIQVRGIGGIRDLLTALGEGSDIDGALGRVMGRDQQGLIRDWEHFVKRRYG